MANPGFILAGVLEASYYRMPLDAMPAEVPDTVDQVGIADGNVQITVRFLYTTT